MPLTPYEAGVIEEILDLFTLAVRKKFAKEDMGPAVDFIEAFDELAADLPKEVQDKLRRGLFQVLK